MAGCSWRRSACRVAGGTALRDVNSTASPDFAAQAAAGIANSGWSADAITTLRDGLPATSVRNASIAAASLAGSLPMMRRARRSPGARASPISIACAPRTAGAPVGLSVSSAVEVARGRLSPFVSRIGARSGGAISTDAAMPPRQSSLSTSVTTRGRDPRVCPG